MQTIQLIASSSHFQPEKQESFPNSGKSISPFFLFTNQFLNLSF